MAVCTSQTTVSLTVFWPTCLPISFCTFLLYLNVAKHPWNMAQPGYPQPVMAQPMVQQQSNTTVIMTQPTQVVLQQGMRDWSTGLCGCYEDCYSCKWKVYPLTGEPTRSKVRRLPFTLYWDLQLDKSPLLTYSNQSELGNRDFAEARFPALVSLCYLRLLWFV